MSRKGDRRAFTPRSGTFALPPRAHAGAEAGAGAGAPSSVEAVLGDEISITADGNGESFADIRYSEPPQYPCPPIAVAANNLQKHTKLWINAVTHTLRNEKLSLEDYVKYTQQLQKIVANPLFDTTLSSDEAHLLKQFMAKHSALAAAISAVEKSLTKEMTKANFGRCWSQCNVTERCYKELLRPLGSKLSGEQPPYAATMSQPMAHRMEKMINEHRVKALVAYVKYDLQQNEHHRLQRLCELMYQALNLNLDAFYFVRALSRLVKDLGAGAEDAYHLLYQQIRDGHGEEKSKPQLPALFYGNGQQVNRLNEIMYYLLTRWLQVVVPTQNKVLLRTILEICDKIHNVTDDMAATVLRIRAQRAVFREFPAANALFPNVKKLMHIGASAPYVLQTFYQRLADLMEEAFLCRNHKFLAEVSEIQDLEQISRKIPEKDWIVVCNLLSITFSRKGQFAQAIAWAKNAVDESARLFEPGGIHARRYQAMLYVCKFNHAVARALQIVRKPEECDITLGSLQEILEHLRLCLSYGAYPPDHLFYLREIEGDIEKFIGTYNMLHDAREQNPVRHYLTINSRPPLSDSTTHLLLAGQAAAEAKGDRRTEAGHEASEARIGSGPGAGAGAGGAR